MTSLIYIQVQNTLFCGCVCCIKSISNGYWSNRDKIHVLYLQFVNRLEPRAKFIPCIPLCRQAGQILGPKHGRIALQLAPSFVSYIKLLPECKKFKSFISLSLWAARFCGNNYVYSLSCKIIVPIINSIGLFAYKYEQYIVGKIYLFFFLQL